MPAGRALRPLVAIEIGLLSSARPAPASSLGSKLTATTSNSLPASNDQRSSALDQPVEHLRAEHRALVVHEREDDRPLAEVVAERAPLGPSRRVNVRSSGICWSSCWSIPTLLSNPGLRLRRVAGVVGREPLRTHRGRSGKNAARRARSAMRALVTFTSYSPAGAGRRWRAAGLAAGTFGMSDGSAAGRFAVRRRMRALKRILDDAGANRQAVLQEELLRLLDRHAGDAAAFVDPAVPFQLLALFFAEVRRFAGSLVSSCGAGGCCPVRRRER